LISLNEAGENLHMLCYGEAYSMRFYIECDGVRLKCGSFDYFMPDALYNWGFTAGTPGVSLTLYSATLGSSNVFTLTFPFSWKRTLKVSVYNPDTANHYAACGVNYNKRLG
jgi:hypothetical protein